MAMSSVVRLFTPVDFDMKDMNYLDLLMKLREAGQTAEKYKRELLSIAESGNPKHHHVAGLKAAYMRAENEFRRLKDQANEIINTAEDVQRET